jgi:hypothetical protein
MQQTVLLSPTVSFGRSTSKPVGQSVTLKSLQNKTVVVEVVVDVVSTLQQTVALSPTVISASSINKPEEQF